MKTIPIKLLVAFIFLANSVTIFGQTNSSLEAETAFMNCIYEALPDKGEKFKKILDAAEKKLIELNYLKNAKGVSYIEIYKNIGNMTAESLRDLGVVSYMEEINKRIGTPETERCMGPIFQDPGFQNTKFSKMMTIVQTVGSYEDNESLTADILSVLSPEDFTHNYYRMTTISMIETMNQKNGQGPDEQPQFVTDKDLTAEEIKNTMLIEVTDDEKIMVNNAETTLDALDDKVASYLKQYEMKNVIALKGSKQASNAFLMNVQNKLLEGFSLIRNTVALEKYNSAFGELTIELQAEIAKTYPIRIKNIK
ncbi:MAG: hypothetical protein AAF611_19650 [Bacteroidota bacterium]